MTVADLIAAIRTKIRPVFDKLWWAITAIVTTALSDLTISHSARFIVNSPRQNFPYVFGHGFFVGAIVGFVFLIYAFMRIISMIISELQELPEQPDPSFERSPWDLSKEHKPQLVREFEEMIGYDLTLLWFIAFVNTMYPILMLISLTHHLLLEVRRLLVSLRDRITSNIDRFTRVSILIVFGAVGSVLGFVFVKGFVGPVVGVIVGLASGNRVNRITHRYEVRFLRSIWKFMISTIIGVGGSAFTAGLDNFVKISHSLSGLVAGFLQGDTPIQIAGAFILGIVNGSLVVILTPIVIALLLGIVFAFGFGIPQSVIRSGIRKLIRTLVSVVPGREF